MHYNHLNNEDENFGSMASSVQKRTLQSNYMSSVPMSPRLQRMIFGQNLPEISQSSTKINIVQDPMPLE